MISGYHVYCRTYIPRILEVYVLGVYKIEISQCVRYNIPDLLGVYKYCGMLDNHEEINNTKYLV